MAQYGGVNSVSDSSENERRTMDTNRFAVFAASQQCTNLVKVVSRSLPNEWRLLRKKTETWEGGSQQKNMSIY